jgi:nucleoside-diphosphate-sugar epimerase
MITPKILVAGATGMTGSYTVKLLLMAKESAREAGPPDRRRGGQAATGTPGVGAGPGPPAVALAEGDLVRPSGSPPRTHPAGRPNVIFFA